MGCMDPSVTLFVFYLHFILYLQNWDNHQWILELNSWKHYMKNTKNKVLNRVLNTVLEIRGEERINL